MRVDFNYLGSTSQHFWLDPLFVGFSGFGAFHSVGLVFCLFFFIL